METKANYTIVGLFTVLVFVAAFAFVFWIARGGTGEQTADLDVVIEGSVTGLGVGSPVYFNGITVGKVTDLRFDPTNPRLVIARSRVRSDLPLTDSTRAVLGFTGLTGIAHIEFEGGDIDRSSVFEMAADGGGVATVTADPSAVNNLLVTAQDIFDRTDSVLSELEGFVADARGPLTTTLANTSKLTNALAENTDKVEQFMTSMGELGGTLEEVSTDVSALLEGVNGLVAAVEPEAVTKIVENAEDVTTNLNVLSEDLTRLGPAITTLSTTIAETAPRIEKSFDQVDAFLAALAPDEINRAVTGFADAGEEIAKLVEDVRTPLTETLGNANQVLASIKPEEIETILAEVSSFTENLNKISGDLSDVGVSVSGLIDSFGDTGPGVEQLVGQLNEVLDAVDPAGINTAIEGFADAGTEIGKAAKEVSTLTDGLGENREEIETILANAAEMAQRLNAASVRVDGVLAKVDSFLGDSSAEGLAADVQSTLAAFRQVADTLNSRLDGITAGLERFSGRGLRDVEALVSETRRSINRIESAISSLESNPQRLLFGGDGDVKRFDGRQRR